MKLLENFKTMLPITYQIKTKMPGENCLKVPGLFIRSWLFKVGCCKFKNEIVMFRTIS